MSSAGESFYRGDAFLIVRGASRLRGSAAERLVCVFQCYLDDSGTSGLPIVTIGGFVAHMSQWERVEPLVDAVMNNHGIEIFHAKEFHDTKPPFKDWSKVRKLSFTEEVFGAAHGALAGIAIGVDKEGLKEGKKRQPGAFDRMSPGGVAFAGIMSRLLTNPAINQAIRQHGVSFLLETDPNNSEIEGYFHRMAKMPVFEGTLRSMTFVPKAHSRAIQLADYLVFYARRKLRNQFRFKQKAIVLPDCPFLSAIHRHGPVYTDLAMGVPRGTGKMLLKDIKNLDEFTALVRGSSQSS